MSTYTSIELKKPVEGIEHLAEFFTFAQWSGMPKAFREPKTQFELAKKLGITPETLSALKQHSRFHDIMSATWKDWAKSQTPDVIEALHKKALKDGTAAETKLWMKLIENWIEKSAHMNLNVEAQAKAEELLTKLAENLKK